MATRSNPAKSAEQYGMAQAVLNGQSDAMPVKVAREMVQKTSAKDRSRFAKELANPKKKQGPISSTLKTIGGAGEFLDSQLGKVFNPRDGRFTGPQGKKAAEQYVRLLEAEGKKARVEKAWGDGYEV